MNTTLSPQQQVRLLVLVGLLALSGLGWWLVVPHSSSKSPATPTTAAPSRPTTTPAVTPTTPSKPVTQPTKLVTHGLPLSVARALQKHRVVVVSLFIPGSKVDELSRAESKAGAKAAGAGFVQLDVFRQKDGSRLLRKLGAVDTPVLLVVRRPALVYARLPGFADRTIVEQAVANARG